MGATYSNLILRYTGTEKVADYLEAHGRDAYMSAATDGFIGVYDKDAEDDDNEVYSLASELTEKLGCLGISFICADDEYFEYMVHSNGLIVDSYSATYGEGEEDDDEEAGSNFEIEPGDVDKLCDLFNVPDKKDEVTKVLDGFNLDGEPLFFPSDMNLKLAELLGMPSSLQMLGYYYLEMDEERREEMKGLTKTSGG